VKISGMVQHLLTYTLIQVVFGGWSPARERLSPFHQRKILEAIAGSNEPITEVVFATGINSLRGNPLSSHRVGKDFRRKRISQTCDAILHVARALQNMFPRATVIYLGSSKLLNDSGFGEEVNSRLKEWNGDILVMTSKVSKRINEWNANPRNARKRQNKGKRIPKMFNAFRNINDLHIQDLYGHLSSQGEREIANEIRAVIAKYETDRE